MQLRKQTKYWLVGLLLMAAACGKKYYHYDNYIKNGPIVFPGRPDSVVALAGKGRVLLKWAVPTDMNIIGYKAFWNFGTDSLPVPGRTPSGTDSVRQYVSNLPEGAYSFTVYAYDKEGHRSVGASTIGNVYGSIFSSIIYNRPVRTKTLDAKTSKVSIAWVGLDAKCIGTQWNYTGTDGAVASFFSPIGDSTFITSCNVALPITYRSLFLPESKAIDTFYTDYKPL